MVTTSTNVDDVLATAKRLAEAGTSVNEAAEEVLAAAGGDRRAVEAARNRAAADLQRRSDDFEATVTLQLLNRVLSRLPIHDPLDWRVRWTQRFRKP